MDRGSVVGRAASEAAVIHIPDVLADPEYQVGSKPKKSVATGRRSARRSCARGTSIGVLICRQKPSHSRLQTNRSSW